MVRKIAEAPPEATAALLEKTSNITLQDPISNQRLNIERMPYGSILTSSANISYEFPDIGHFAEECKETLMTNIRAICAHYGISEVQLSQNTNSNTYASAIVAESPSHKNFLRWQKMCGDFIAGKRTQPQQSIMWKQLVYAVERGLLPSNALTDLRITYRGPSVITRDIQQEAQSNKIYYDMGIKSANDIAAELGIDYEQQKKHKMSDDGIDNILSTVTKLNNAGIGNEGAKALFKKYHPTVEDSIVDNLFTEMKSAKGNNEQEEELPKPKKPTGANSSK
jgi:hypothetical protein